MNLIDRLVCVFFGHITHPSLGFRCVCCGKRIHNRKAHR